MEVKNDKALLVLQHVYYLLNFNIKHKNQASNSGLHRQFSLPITVGPCRQMHCMAPRGGPCFKHFAPRHETWLKVRSGFIDNPSSTWIGGDNETKRQEISQQKTIAQLTLKTGGDITTTQRPPILPWTATHIHAPACFLSPLLTSILTKERQTPIASGHNL